jgi:hypothetical protein
MTGKRFYMDKDGDLYDKDNGLLILDFGYAYNGINCKRLIDLLNAFNDENEQLKSKLEDWHQRTFKAHEYFNILEKVIEEVCNDEISNQIWKEYGKREKLVE